MIMWLKLKYLLCPNVAKCKKDLVLIVDTSNSIGEHDFNHNVKKFLKNLVTDSRLNVGPDGTEIGLILFSSRERTMVKGDVKSVLRTFSAHNNIPMTGTVRWNFNSIKQSLLLCLQF